MSSIAQPVARSVSRSVLAGQRMNLGYLIRSMFSNSEQGFAYDINDLSTLFQDAAGTMPVTGAGQPVGLVLDKSKGLVLGSELVVNGDFSNGTSGWTLVNSKFSIVGGKLQVASLSMDPGFASQAIQTEVGRWYELTVDVTLINYSTAAISVGTVYNNVDVASAVYYSNGKFTLKFLAKTTTSYILLQPWPNKLGQTCQFGNVSVKTLAGNHAYQTTSSMRPLLQRNATTGAYYLAFDGTDDFLVTNNINFTSTGKVSLFAGVRKLSDSADFPMIAETGTSANDSGSFHLYANSSTTSRGYVFAATGATQVWRKMTTDYASPDSAVITAFANLSATGDLAVKQRRNGVNQTLDMGGGNLTGGGNFSNRPLYIGRRAGTAYPFTGHIYSLIGVGRLSTDAETTALEKAIAKNVGVML